MSGRKICSDESDYRLSEVRSNGGGTTEVWPGLTWCVVEEIRNLVQQQEHRPLFHHLSVHSGEYCRVCTKKFKSNLITSLNRVEGKRTKQKQHITKNDFCAKDLDMLIVSSAAVE